MARRTRPVRPLPVAAVFSALGDPVRLRLLEALADGPSPVHVLAGLFSISRPAISRHLRVLKDAGLVREVKAGRENRYERVEGGLLPARGWLGDGAVPAVDPPPQAATEEPPVPTGQVPEKRPRKAKAAYPDGLDSGRPQLSLFD